MKDKELYKLMLKNGWELKRINGSHHIMVKGNDVEVIPIHGKEIKTGLAKAIIKKWDLK